MYFTKLTTLIGIGVDLMGSVFGVSDVLSGVSAATRAQLLELLTATISIDDPTMIYQSTRDSATGDAFHAHCDAQGPTLTLIKDTDNNVFGGCRSNRFLTRMCF